MSSQYRQFLKILEKWPLDKNKQGRDIAEHLRSLLPILQQPDRSTTAEQMEHINKQNDALNRLSKNIYFSTYKREHHSTATGLSANQCSQVLSSEFLQYLKEQKD
ncbi:ubiquinol-cytochrome-c reductase complex assembly factor 2 [Episyrphus balteatus]|uniref:ubiquinol-cytochrome-c reductase complex assembly factor 2 n=1 Tax=Episyrphus balteatus TaxID=286459 RepID=UPI002485B2EF|nr:ubiquinol-cytochrome-c reductase complex assembly factor 2 [Episyrphus balteatus]